MALTGRNVMRSQAEKGRLFRELHKRPEILILPNPWDAGTAKLLASLGFEALATTSLGHVQRAGPHRWRGFREPRRTPRELPRDRSGHRPASQRRPGKRL